MEQMDANVEVPEMAFGESSDSIEKGIDKEFWYIMGGILVAIIIIVIIYYFLMKRANRRANEQIDSFENDLYNNVEIRNGVMVHKSTGVPLTKEEIEDISKKSIENIERRNKPYDEKIKDIRKKAMSEINVLNDLDLTQKREYILANIQKNHKLHLQEHGKKIKRMSRAMQNASPSAVNINFNQSSKDVNYPKIKAFLETLNEQDINFMLLIAIEGVESQIKSKGKQDKLKEVLKYKSYLYGVDESTIDSIIDGVKGGKVKESQVFVLGMMGTSPQKLIEISKYQEDIYNAFI